MKKIIYGVVSICFITCLSAFAASQEEAFARIHDVHLETQQLRCELERVRAELNRLEARKSRPAPFWRRLYPCRDPLINVPPYGPPRNCNKCNSNGEGNDAPTESGFAENNRNFDDFYRTMGSPRNILLLAALGATVTTSPFLGLRSAFDASDLIVNLPTMNEDLRFLKEHVEIDKKLKSYGIKLPDRPIIELGGKIEGVLFAQEDYRDGPTSTDIDIGSVRLDVLVEVSRGVHGFMALNMDSSSFNLLNNTNLDIQLAGAGARIFNSRVYVSRAFVTVGDLNCLPVYFTIGQMFVPFGRYASNMVTSTLTVQLARTNERALLLGLYKNGLYGSLYAYSGATNFGNNGVDTWGTNWGFEKSFSNGSFNIGAGYIGNLADATGFQITGNSVGFFGFGLNSFTEIIEHRVPAVDVHTEFSYGRFSVFAEYIKCIRRYAFENLSFNDQGAEPSASNVELAYNFQIMKCPASLAVGYGTTSEALALGLPKSSVISAFNISIWKDTIESLEFRHDDNYNSTDFAGGNGAIPPFVFSGGGSRNTYTAQIGVYF